jgi:hypothetical protein
MTGRLIKICPACGHINDLAEIFCTGIQEDGTTCSYNLLDVEATQEGRPPVASDSPPLAADVSDRSPQPSAESLDSNGFSRVCLNGHSLEEGDLLCLTCGAVPASQVVSEAIASEPEPASESWQGETLADLPEAQRRDPALLRALLGELDALLYRLQLEGGNHGDLQPDQVRLVSRQPLRLELGSSAGESSSPPSGDLTINPTSAVGLYSAPERLVGIQAPNSDWWSLGLLILEWLVGPSFWQGVHQQAWQLRVITDGVTIPDTVTDPWRSLLMGLLTRDPNDRWGHSEVIRWLDGDEEIPLLVEEPQVGDQGSIIRLAGQRYRSPDRYALAAAQAEVWDEALAQLQQGELLTWLEQNNLPADSLAEVKRLAADESLDQDERLMLVLLLLNLNLPLCLRGEVIGAGNLAADPQRARAWLSGVLPGRLRRIGRHTWLADLADRREAALEQARTLRLNLAEARFDAAALIGDRRRLEQAWAERRQEWPAALHNGLSNLISRSRQSEEQLLLLVSAELEQFRSAADVLNEAERLAKQSKVAGHWDQAAARRWLANSQRDIFRALQEHVADFVRCGQRQPDDWADQFRSDQNLPLPQALVLLSIPLECWVRPEGGEHWQRLLYFFRRRVLSGIQRGPLLALSVTATGKRIDLAELTSQALPANTLVDHLVSRQARARSLDPDLLDANQQLSQRLRRLRQEADAYQRETGIAALYLGYPLLVKRDQAPNTGTPRKPKLIPLLLWPVRLSITGQGNLPQLGYDRDHGSGDGIRLNPAVGGVLSHRQNQSLQEALEELHQRSSLTGAQVMDVLRTIFSGSEGILERCPQKPSLPTGSDEYLQPSGVLFLCSFSAQTLAHELEQLERRPSLEGPMAALLRLTPDSPFPAKAPCAPAEHERFLVTPADPSQKRAVWASRQEPGVLIQGPPGTGKSQTIVNIVADAIGRHERVLVVCQKQAALEVVRNRLEAAQLGDRLCLITDPSSDRRSLLKKLREDLEVWDPNHRRDEFARERQAIATDVARLESELDGLYQAMATPLANSGLNDQQVIDGLLQLGINPNVPALTALRPLLQNCHVEEVRTIARQCADIASLWLRAQPEDSPLHVLRVFSTDESNLNSFSHALKQFQELELARVKDFAEPSEVLESSDPKAVQCWIDSYASTLQVVDVNLAVLVTRWLPLFSDSTSRLIRERLEVLDQKRRLNKEPGVMVKWQARLTDLQDVAIENLLSAARQWSPKHARLFSCLTREATNASIFDAFNNAFAKLLNIERIRVALHGSSKAVIEAREAGVAQAWLDNGGSSIAPATDELASHFSRWIPLFDDSSGKLIREQLAVLGSERRLIGDTEIMMKWQALSTDLDGIAVESLLYAARQWRSKQAFFFSSLTHEATNQTSIAVFSQAITGLLSSERARTNLFGLSENVLEVSEIGMAQTWLDNGGSRISETNDQLAARVSMWLPLFGDSSSKQIRERLGVLGAKRRMIKAPGSIVKWDAFMADLKVLEMEDLHVATREWRKCREAFDPLFISHLQDLKRETAPWTTLQALYGFEHEKSIIEPTILGATEASYLSGVVAWLEENESVIGGADIATAPLLAPCLKLYESDRWRLIRLSLNKSKSSLESQKPGQGAFGWDFEARSLGDELLSRLLSATQIRKQWMRSPSRIFRPSYLRSKALLKSIFPESVNNKDENQIASLEQLLEHEILLRNECREYEQILRDLGLFKKISNLPQHELLSSVDALIQQLDSVETILDAVSRCPLRQEAEQAIRSGRRDQILGFLESLKREIKRQHYRQQSLQVLHELSAWCAPDWLSGLGQKIKRDQMIIPELEEIFAIWSSLVDAEKVILQHVPEFVDNKDSNHIGSLEQALEYQIQLRHDCRQYEQILRDLGLFEKVSNLPQHELLSNVDALIQQLDSVETILDAVSRCPLRQEAEQAIRSGQRDQILEFLESLKRGIKRQHHRHQSLQALHELSAWCRPDWQSGLEQKIKGNQPIISELEEIFAIWSSLVDAEKVILQHVPEFVDNKDPNQIGSLEQALEYEIQLRQDCRIFQNIRSDLGFSHNSTNLSQSDLLAGMHELLEQFDQVSSVVLAISECPLQIDASDVVRSGQPERISAFINSLHRGVRRQELRHMSRLLLKDLSLWCERNWLETLEQRIDSDQQVGVELEPVAQGCHRLVDFQLYRSRAASLSANEQSVMRVLATERNHWQAVAPEHLAETVRITVEREALLGWQAGAEALEPALLLTRQDVDRRIKRLAEQDAHLLDLNRRMTAIPAAPERVQPRPNWDDIVMLQGPRARKLREVVELGEERGLFEICPVWLANPETVSQIFPLRQGLFDLVIFDEASQLPVENALPAMYRANRIVISGDEKQLPPTRFFSSGFADESDEEFNPDADGDDPEILAEAINAAETRRQVKDCGDLLVLASAAGLTHVSLDIHYRSRFRPLIAHSNAAFYQNKLSVPVLHPAEEIRRTRPLQVEVINGTYANQSNRDEAVALIAFLDDLWCGPHAAEHGTLPTVGVVTFNKTQADLIEDLLDRYTQTNPQFQQILERERQRRFQGEDCGFFVKNLENVQGDERDWILFSTTFGRDESGRFMRRFGALGLKGGERRLNVATSRARDKLVIFSSMPIEEISDAHRQGKTPQRPRDFLQSYLLYASAISEGHLDEAESLLNRLHRPNSSRVAAGARHTQRYFVQCVAEYLRKKGFEVDVPAAGDAFAFDLALRNPATGLFALGIECDPPRHPDLAHARDREIWRPRVLESSLPNVHRVWSRLWLIEPAREQRRLSDAVRKALPSPSPAP